MRYSGHAIRRFPMRCLTLIDVLECGVPAAFGGSTSPTAASLGVCEQKQRERFLQREEILDPGYSLVVFWSGAEEMAGVASAVSGCPAHTYGVILCPFLPFGLIISIYIIVSPPDMSTRGSSPGVLGVFMVAALGKGAVTNITRMAQGPGQRMPKWRNWVAPDNKLTCSRMPSGPVFILMP